MGTLDIYCTLTTTAGVYKTTLFISMDNVSNAGLAQGSRLTRLWLAVTDLFICSQIML